jgi:hypothetical protein
MDLVAALADVVAAPPAPNAKPFDIVDALQAHLLGKALDGLDPAPHRASPPPPPVVVHDDAARDDRPLRGAALAAALDAQRGAQPDRMPWPASWLERNDPADAHRCLQLWSEALRMLLVDACEEVCKDFDRRDHWDGQSEKMRRGPRPLVRSAWVGSSDFMAVCALAGLDGRAVCDRVSAKLATREGAAALGLALSAAVRSSFGPTRDAFTNGGRDD